MSVLLKNECTEKHCGKVFQTLSDLIIHREKEHLDFSPFKVQQLEDEKVECIPMSYVLKFSKPGDPEPRQVEDKTEMKFSYNDSVTNNIPTLSEVCKFFSNNNNNNYFGYDYKEKKGEFVNINDLRVPEKLSPDFLMHLNCKIYTYDNTFKKPFGCNMPGCNKRYKNVNGVKYHCKNFHNIYNSAVFKKSLLKMKQPSSCSSSRTKSQKNELHGAPLLNFTPQPPPPQPCPSVPNDIIYRNVQRFEDREAPPPDFVYKFSPLFPPPGSNDYINQMPLPNLGFNCYNTLSDFRDELEDFNDQSSASSFTVPFDKP